MNGHSGPVGSRRERLVFRLDDGPSQAQILATRREKRGGMLANLQRRQAAAKYAIERLLNEGGRNLNVNIRKIHPDAVVPQYATIGAAGFDLVAVEDVIIEPGETVKIPLGLAFEIPEGYEMQIRPRSGISLNTKLRVQLGTVDSDYRDGVSAIIDNIAQPLLEIDPFGNCVVRISRMIDLLDGSRVIIPPETPEEYYPRRTYLIRKGDRVAQGVIQAAPAFTFTEVGELSETERGIGGFGSTGTKQKPLTG